MKVTINKQSEKTLVVLDGRIDSTNADQFQQDIAPLMEGEKPDIDIDCTNMTYTSSQGPCVPALAEKRHGSQWQDGVTQHESTREGGLRHHWILQYHHHNLI